MAQFIDHVSIQVESGAGGNGMVAWRREKYVPYGGPAGGDGGNGGSVILEATNDINTLLDFKYKSIFKADPGEKGRSKNQHGKNSKDLIIKVPCGTIVRDEETGEAIADLTEAGQQALVAQGGRGGKGNTRFASSRRQAPHFAEPGEAAVERTLSLELKLIAEVGIIGLPNAGKSTLISVVSAAKPKIANYPFTTLTPNLGVVRRPNGDGVVLADIPGLVEGASEGVGLGHEFLRHVERTRVLIHLVDISGETDPVESYQLINEELNRYSQKLAGKPQLLVLSKADTVDEETLSEYQKTFQQFVDEQKSSTVSQDKVLTISSATQQGVDSMMDVLFDWLDKVPRDEHVVEIVEDTRATSNDDSTFEIERENNVFYVTSGKAERFVGITDFKNGASVHHLMYVLKDMGIFDALATKGAQEGHVVSIGGVDFDYFNDWD